MVGLVVVDWDVNGGNGSDGWGINVGKIGLNPIQSAENGINPKFLPNAFN